MQPAPHDFQDDLDMIAAIPAVGTILEVVCRTTGMRFAAVARVTGDRWVCCASKDDLEFGLAPGGELWVETTICQEIRASGDPVAIDEVARDAVFCGHPTPALYGFQSYISMPIMLEDGGFWGTLCAIDAAPHSLNNPAVTGMFRLLAQLIATQIDLHRKLQVSEAANTRLAETFRAGLGHDLKNTLQAMDAGTRLLAKTPLNERGQLILGEMRNQVARLAAQVTQAMDAAAPHN
jgi:GAF domain-containing protein